MVTLSRYVIRKQVFTIPNAHHTPGVETPKIAQTQRSGLRCIPDLQVTCNHIHPLTIPWTEHLTPTPRRCSSHLPHTNIPDVRRLNRAIRPYHLLCRTPHALPPHRDATGAKADTCSHYLVDSLAVPCAPLAGVGAGFSVDGVSHWTGIEKGGVHKHVLIFCVRNVADTLCLRAVPTE
jgi:hypothetical protein